MNTVTITVARERPVSIDDSLTVMSLEETRRTQRPYRYGMMLLCVGALVNWLGLAENYSEPVRYAGVACILAGACLICTAMCCWLHTPNRAGSGDENDDGVHRNSANDERRQEKPPDYDTVAVAPPSYDDAIKLDPAALLRLSLASNGINAPSQPSGDDQTSTSRPSSSYMSTVGHQLRQDSGVSDPSPPESLKRCSVSVIDEKSCPEKPPPYEESTISSSAFQIRRNSLATPTTN
ncbi:uncharacterized protein LOC126569197 isoform X1 [Anopheles aquasalis]|uniref:uncharacterized protein LOC126569197 isoform X1 n=2 Tax=Anopheles aquasalis TaxID=42839 RepID=UPI00215AE849|nr:uncharacterized protein LOC126569197 isoform X1 [Anopheles aquasalis]XP_050082085.1 uncharacterized protein LOC126569197 isoform X1 [Anopheles aquasalis]XP_050082086.1 uncharacterized protein LOC126569197 isoform X1 [Anopheles aquasalis]